MTAPIYYINLDRTPARAAYMGAVFSKLGLPATRICAVDGLDLDDATCRALNPQRPGNERLNPGEVGCWLSHRKVWTQIAHSDHAFGIVFEDDIAFSDDAVQFLSDLSWLPDSIEFVKLDASPWRTEMGPQHSLPNTDRTLRTARSAMVSTAGYALSKRCARHLLAHTNELRSFTDLQLFDPKFKTFGAISVWQLYPAICSQKGPDDDQIDLPDEVAKSDLLEARDARKNAQQKMKFGPAKVWREIMRPLIKYRLRPRDLVNRLWWGTTLQTILFRR